MPGIENMMVLVFIIEFVIIIVFLSIILIAKALFNLGYKFYYRLYRRLSETLANSFVHKRPFKHQFRLKTYYSLSTLLTVLETFDQRFKGNEWKELKSEIIRVHLIDRARKWSRSRLWIRRNFSVRVFALSATTEDQAVVLQLMDDRVFLVRSIAAIFAVRNEVKEGVYKVLQQMGENRGYGYYYYRDLLLTGSETILLWVEGFATLRKDTAFHLACLHVLDTAYLHLYQLSLDEDFYSANPQLRLAACKIYANNPQPESPQKLAEALADKDPKIRAEAAIGLSQFYSSKVLTALEEALNDEDFHVRKQAGLSLSKFGSKGIESLKAYSKTNNEKAFEAAQYALKFSEVF